MMDRVVPDKTTVEKPIDEDRVEELLPDSDNTFLNECVDYVIYPEVSDGSFTIPDSPTGETPEDQKQRLKKLMTFFNNMNVIVQDNSFISKDYVNDILTQLMHNNIITKTEKETYLKMVYPTTRPTVGGRKRRRTKRKRFRNKYTRRI